MKLKMKRPNSEGEVSGATTVQEAGRRGGRATLENKGVDFFKRIGAQGGKRTAELYRDLLVEFGRMGGRRPRPPLD
jgi:general stress protein YciG